MSALGRFGLGNVDQIGYVVADLEQSLPRYEALFGSFTISEAALPDCTIRGEQADCALRIAVNDSGPVEIELIQVLEGDTPHSEHLREHGEGPHHVRFRVDALEPKLTELEAEGFEPLMFKRFGPGVAFAYVACPKELGGSVIELLEMP